MKSLGILLLLASLIVVAAACTPAPETPTPEPAASAGGSSILTITGGEAEHAYTLAMLQALPSTPVQSDDGSFVGVRLSDLLADAGFDMNAIASVSVMALDGFRSTYDDPALYTREDAVLAYSRESADLNSDELPLRMVIPGQEGRMQPRQVSAIEVSLAE